MILLFGLILIGFVLGVVAVVAAEALGVWLIIKRLSTKIKRDEEKNSSKSEQGGGELDPQQSLSFAFNKQGVVWVLEPEKIPKIWQEKPSREQKRKKDLEVSPVKKYGKIKDQSLILTEPDSFHITTIQLKGCIVVAVSASALSSRKWAKKFPIKLESKTSVIYNGSKTLHIYLETSWEKEAWCKALRLASCDKTEKVNWFAKMNEEFHNYLTYLNSEYHYFMKPSVGYNVESIERASKPDAASSKVRQFWRKFSRKASKVGSDNKSTCTSLSGREERKSTDKLCASQDAVLATAFMKSALTAKPPKFPVEDNGAAPLPSALSRSASQSSHTSVNSDADPDEKFGIDEGTLCWNLLISRLFFDAIGNADVKRSMQARIQRTLSSMRTPSYVGEVICTDINIGSFPPFIVGMRVLPMEMTEVWAFEVDIVYSGGAVLGIETRLEVCEQDLDRGIEDSDPESSKVGNVSSDLLEGFGYIGKQLNLAEGTSDVKKPKEDGDVNTDGSKSSRSFVSSSTSGSRWKSMVNSIAKQVSQVPLSLAIRVASLKGTLRLHLKPPPSDQLWYGFTSMPDVDFNLESSVGDHKITSAHVALFLINRLKAAIRETMVLPNCENISIPWMLAEKDDWVPRSIAPFVWINQESANEATTVSIQPPGEGKTIWEASARTSNDASRHKQLKSKSAVYGQEPTWKPSDSLAQPSNSGSTLRTSRSSDELKMPSLQQKSGDLEPRSISLQNDGVRESSQLKIEDSSECESPPRNDVSLLDKQNRSIEQDGTRRKKIGKRERMLDLRKRMSEKFEEKRRHIGEKGRHIVEKMRGP